MWHPGDIMINLFTHWTSQQPKRLKAFFLAAGCKCMALSTSCSAKLCWVLPKHPFAILCPSLEKLLALLGSLGFELFFRFWSASNTKWINGNHISFNDAKASCTSRILILSAKTLKDLWREKPWWNMRKQIAFRGELESKRTGPTSPQNTSGFWLWKVFSFNVKGINPPSVAPGLPGTPPSNPPLSLVALWPRVAHH